MTKAVLFRSPSGLFTGFHISGHSGYAESGYDIVCAAVSVLSITCINALEETAGVKVQAVSDEDGELKMCFCEEISSEKMHDTQIIMNTIRRGFQDLAQEYPRFFRFAIKERRKLK